MISNNNSCQYPFRGILDQLEEWLENYWGSLIKGNFNNPALGIFLRQDVPEFALCFKWKHSPYNLFYVS